MMWYNSTALELQLSLPRSCLDLCVGPEYHMGSSLNWGHFYGPFYRGAVVNWGTSKEVPNLENYPKASQRERERMMKFS